MHIYSYICSIIFQESKQPLLKLLDTVLTDAGKIPLWVQQTFKRAFIMVVLTTMTVILRFYHGGKTSTELFHK